MTGSAKVLASADERRLLAHVTDLRHPNRNRVIILLSFKAGLRAGEIAGLDWQMLLHPNGRLADHIVIADSIAKMKSGRTVPINPALKLALREWHVDCGRPCSGPVIKSERGGHFSAKGIVNFFAAAYSELGMMGCSSHSGRRTFITRTARLLARAGGSLRDVQELAGHRALTTTERYIQGDRDIQRKLVRLI